MAAPDGGQRLLRRGPAEPTTRRGSTAPRRRPPDPRSNGTVRRIGAYRPGVPTPPARAADHARPPTPIRHEPRRDRGDAQGPGRYREIADPLRPRGDAGGSGGRRPDRRAGSGGGDGMTREWSDRDLRSARDRWMNEVAPAAIPVPVLEEAFARTMSARQLRVYPWERIA